MNRHLGLRVRIRTLFVLLLLVTPALAGLARAAGGATAPLQRLPPPDKGHAAVRAKVQERMGRHGNTMSNLVKAVVLLDRPTIVILAGRIADEEVVARVEADESEKRLRELLPKAFFAEQDALRSAARDLAAAATHREKDAILADRFATLTRTCVSCHSVYLRDLLPQR